MSENFDFLKNPFHGLKQDDVPQIQNRCKEIAENLFNNYCIQCGDTKFRFAEIEFYYYKKKESCENNFDSTWNLETYPRNKKAGDFFFHYSGVDVCFQCDFEELEKRDEYGEFGGILIRSLRRGDKILAGPLFCANTLLNTCNKEMPELKTTDRQKHTLDTTTRCGISTDNNQEQEKKLYLCYYATHVEDVELKWDNVSERISWDKTQHRFKKSYRNYKKERFDE